MTKRTMNFVTPVRRTCARTTYVQRRPTRAIGLRRRRYRRRRLYIPRTITPDTKICKLRYCFTQTLEPSSGATKNVIVRANDLVAPSSGSGAHKPMGFDEIMMLYERFCVVGSKIHVAFVNNGSSATNKNIYSIVGIALRNNETQESVQDNTASQTNEGMLERNRIKWRYGGFNGGGAPITTVTSKFGAKKFFHLSTINSNAGNNRDEGTLWGTASSSPTTLAYYKLFCATFLDSVQGGWTVRVTVDYTAVFQGRKLLGQST